MALVTEGKAWPGWCEYFDALPLYDRMVVDVDACVEKLREFSPLLFTDKSVNVETIDFLPYCVGGKTSKSMVYRDKESLRTILAASHSPVPRVVSISQDHSLAPFNIDEESMCRLLAKHHVPPEFVDLLLSFGDKKATSSEGSGRVTLMNIDHGSLDIVYQLRYVEENGYGNSAPWSMRQVCVYHHYSVLEPGNTENFFILLHPMRGSKVQGRLPEAVDKYIDNQKTEFDPFRVHALVFSSYVDNWRWYVHYISRECDKLEDSLLTCDLDDREESRDLGLNFDTLQALRHLALKLIPVPAIIRSSMAILEELQTMNRTITRPHDEKKFAEITRYLTCYSSRLGEYLESTNVVQQRIENMTKFLANSLDLQNQSVSVDMNDHLLKLTKDTVDDSTTVHIITLITLFYLPANFISGLLGMNLFSFDSDTTSLRISIDFWIFAVASIVLTALTIGAWKYYIWLKKRHNRPLDLQGANAV